MKKLFCLIFILSFAITSNADSSNIIAIVNDGLITLREFNERKHMIIKINNITDTDSDKDAQLNQIVIEKLIREKLIYQSTPKSRVVSQEEINRNIALIEERNKMSPGGLMAMLKSKSIDPDTFRAMIVSEILEMDIINSLSRLISVSQKEIEDIIFQSKSKDAKIVALSFVSKDKEDKSLHKMYNLARHLPVCSKVKESLYNEFARLDKIDQNFSTLSSYMQTLVKDLAIGEKSKVFEIKDGFSIIVICDKKLIDVTPDENAYVLNLLTQKKMSQKMQKFFDDMRKRAYVKVMLYNLQ